MPSPQRSLGHSLFNQKFSQKFLCFFFCFFFLFLFVFYFIKISKFALPGVMLMYERTSKDRKKESIGVLGIQDMCHFTSRDMGYLVQYFVTSRDIENLGKLIMGIFADL